MRKLACILLFALPLFADVTALVREGVALYDQRRYDEAIVKFKAALAEDPSSALAAYELAMTYHAKGDPAQCVSTLEPHTRTKGPLQAPMYVIIGNCHDAGGDPKRAIDSYRQGLQIDGENTQLLYNLSVTLFSRGEYDEARTLLKKELALDPAHRSGHFVLGRVFEEQNFRTAATLTYLRFLSLEPSGKRAKEVATRALALLGAGIEVKDDKNVNITIDPEPRKEEGDYSTAEMMMAIAGAGALKLLEENEKKSEFERTLGHVSSALAMIAEGEPQSDYTGQHVVPFFRALYDRKLLDAYAAVAISSLGLPGGDEWRAANKESIDAYTRFMSGGK